MIFGSEAFFEIHVRPASSVRFQRSIAWAAARLGRRRRIGSMFGRGGCRRPMGLYTLHLC